jgi:hypothetical protein
MQLPLVQNCANRTIIGRFASSDWAVEILPNRAKARTRYAPKVKNSLPRSCTTRERGARESRASGLSRVRAFTRACSREEKFGLRRSCSRPKASVQPLKAKRNPVAIR